MLILHSVKPTVDPAKTGNLTEDHGHQRKAGCREVVHKSKHINAALEYHWHAQCKTDQANRQSKLFSSWPQVSSVLVDDSGYERFDRTKLTVGSENDEH